ncbi:hypothetical protein TNCV_4057641 [Trichonephila clavipes]|nr:hypothetical protein TNCV_4057641 [Trichonephila clavipes]
MQEFKLNDSCRITTKVNLKALSNMVLIPQHWSFRREYSQDKSGMGKLAWKLTDFIKRDDFKVIDPAWMKKGVVRKLRKSEIEFQIRCFKRHAKPKVTIQADKASSRAYWDEERGVAET